MPQDDPGAAFIPYSLPQPGASAFILLERLAFGNHPPTLAMAFSARRNTPAFDERLPGRRHRNNKRIPIRMGMYRRKRLVFGAARA